MDSRTTALRQRKIALTRIYLDILKRCRDEQRMPTESEMTRLMGSDLQLKLLAESFAEADGARDEAA